MRVYGIKEIALALDKPAGLVAKWRERNKLPPADAELSIGPVWLAGTIEPLIQAGGPDPRPPGHRLDRYGVSATMTTSPYPVIDWQMRRVFESSIWTLRHPTLPEPTVCWKSDRSVEISFGNVAPDERIAADSAKSIIMRRAQLEANIGVDEVTIDRVAPLGRWPS